MKPWTPLNGTKTHPLSKLAAATLESLKSAPVVARDLNPGLVNRLLRTGDVTLQPMLLPWDGAKTRTATCLVHKDWKPTQ